MKNLIEPLTRIPGVRTAALVTTDGVLMAMHSSTDNARDGSGNTRDGSSKARDGSANARDGSANARDGSANTHDSSGPSRGESSGSGGAEDGERSSTDAALDPQALAGLATSWLSEVTRAVAPLSWQPPRHLVLRAARGTMIVCEAPGAILCVVLESGMQPEELRLPMGVTIARMQRHLRDIGQRTQRNAPEIESIRSAVPSDIEQPPGIRPALPSNSPHGQAVPLGHGEPIVQATGKGVSESSGD